MFMLPPKLMAKRRKAAAEKHQTYSAAVEEWIEKGLAEHEARKSASATPGHRETGHD
jgi:hypothetical protein